jgi:hypothetical protein
MNEAGVVIPGAMALIVRMRMAVGTLGPKMRDGALQEMRFGWMPASMRRACSIGLAF